MFFCVQYSFQKVNAVLFTYTSKVFFFWFQWQFICYFYGKLGSVVLIAAVTLCSCSWQHRFARDHLPCIPSSPQLEKTVFIVTAIQLQLRGHLGICKCLSPLVGAALVSMDKGCSYPFNDLNSIYPPTGFAVFFPSFVWFWHPNDLTLENVLGLIWWLTTPTILKSLRSLYLF